jgi:hypothetical protein
VAEIGFPSGGFAQLAGRQPVLCESALRCAEEAGDHLRRHAAFLGHFPSRVGPLAAQPEEQANDLFLPRTELTQQPRYVLEIHAVPLVIRILFRGPTVPPWVTGSSTSTIRQNPGLRLTLFQGKSSSRFQRGMVGHGRH